MNLNTDFTIDRYDFTSNMFNEIQNVHYAKDLWPVVYILSDGSIQEAYVGETTDTFARMSSHLKNNAKIKLTTVHLITSNKFNKSATLDIESNLIKYISGDGQYELLNGNIGLAHHNYYQKNEVYWDIFKSIWQKLRSEGIAKHSIEYINNSDLFKYSPYKSLSNDQRKSLLVILKSLLTNDVKNVVIEGGAGTGKTILAIFLFKLLLTNNDDFNFKEFGDDELEFIQIIIALKKNYPNPKMALVVPMSSFRNTLKKVFKNVKGLNAKMVIGPAEIVKNDYDIVIVDEAHRLRRRVNLGTYFGAFDVVCKKLNLDNLKSNELDWIVKKSDKAIFFYDENQSIKPSDIKSEDFKRLKSANSTQLMSLKSQFRVKGGIDYVNYIDDLMSCNLSLTKNVFHSTKYEFLLFDSVEAMVSEIKRRDTENGLSRLIAGFSWPWISKKNQALQDIEIENFSLKWNSVTVDYINSENAINEVGCIHTTQGYDLNYAGIIFGNEISYNKEKNEIVVLKENYYDTNGKQSINNPEELKNFIVNIYKTVMLRGIRGTYVYVCDKNLKEYFGKHIAKYEKDILPLHVPLSKVVPFENSVPVYDLKASAGNFSEVQNVNDFEWVELPSRYKPSKDLFACKVEGESMNKIIPNGSICLFRKYTGGSRNGKIVLVEHTDIQESDFGSGYTVKEYRSTKNIENDEWSHQSITLKPLSHNSEYKDIELSEDESSSLKVIGVFECVL
ncbi:MAG TPA: DNA/RNA helicase domain-containing protein [Chitinophagaceae bacterium]|nr:DNA/RNA helicase domain-containing protein [Chitinophagaceae bacterium]